MMKSPFTDSRNISMRILRGEDKSEDGEMDDHLVIVDQGDNLYHVYYRDGTWDEKQTAHMIAVTADELDAYLENLFYLLARDCQPFRSIQLNIPCMPSVMLSIDSLKKKSIRAALFDILASLSSCIKVKF